MLNVSPAEVISYLLLDLGVGSDPEQSQDWPVFATAEADAPDNILWVYDTAGLDDGRAQEDGEVWHHYGFQVTVRAVDHPTGWAKADAVRDALSKRVKNAVVTVASARRDRYLVPAVSGVGPVLPLGVDSPNTKRHLFTVNAVAAILAL